MTNESRTAFEAWWEDFKSEHDEWQYADSDALRLEAWQASRKVALEDAAIVCGNRSKDHGSAIAHDEAGLCAEQIRSLK